MTKEAGGSHRTLQGHLILAMKGYCMGAADVVPGVSGGTMALILGIYEEFVRSIRSFDLRFLKLLLSLKPKEAWGGTPWRFLAAVSAGILLAFFTLARILGWLLHNRPILIWSFFFGLILASVFAVSRNLDRWTPSVVALIAFGSAGTYFLVGMVPASTPESPWFLFLCGTLAICAMILPGISGAFILVLLGKYHYLLEALNKGDICPLFIVAMGACVGLVTFVRLLNWLFSRYYTLTMAVLTGLMFGSLRKVWPWKRSLKTVTGPLDHGVLTRQINVLPQDWNTQTGLAISLVAIGFFLVLSLNFLAHKDK